MTEEVLSPFRRSSDEIMTMNVLRFKETIHFSKTVIGKDLF